jgi:drug/metabolite transporter (DMT)-like permease
MIATTGVSSAVVAAVLLAAACHAGWNAMMKTGSDPFTTLTLVAVGAGIIGLPLLILFGLPARAAWPWLAASGVVHLAYSVGLIEAYRAGDLGQVYPIARGSAPLLTAAASALFVGEALPSPVWAGIAVLAGGIVLLSVGGGRELRRFNRRAVGFALFTALAICAYSVIDGIGARNAASPHAYAAALFVIYGSAMIALALAWRGANAAPLLVRSWKRGLTGGALSFLAYWIVIWAMTVAPIAVVASLRETSVLFGAGIAVVLLGEPLHVPRIVAAVLIVAGLVLIRIY